MERSDSIYSESSQSEYSCYGGDSSNLVDRYDLRQCLGKGSMGKVKLGVDIFTREKVMLFFFS
jgi:hypothetical protein